MHPPDPLLDLLGDSVIGCDAAGRVRSWNHASSVLYGYPTALALGQPLDTLLQTRPLPTPMVGFHGVVERRSADGRNLTVELRRSGADATGGWLEVGTDRTALLQAQQALADSEYRYSNLFQAMAVAFWELDFSGVGALLRGLRSAGISDLRSHVAAHPELARQMMAATRVVDVNERSVVLFGRGDKQELLQTVEPFWPPASSAVYADSVAAAISGKAHHIAETRLRNLDGTEIDVLFTACFPAASVARGRLLVGIIDQSEPVAARAAVSRMQAELAHAARIASLGELTASIAHELNQPLAAIATRAAAGQRWLNRPQPELDEVRPLLDGIVLDARRAADTIARIRNMATRHAPVQAALDLGEVIAESLEFLRHELDARRVALRLESARDLPAVIGDRVQLQQVLVNLAVNAIQAMTGAASVEPRTLSVSSVLVEVRGEPRIEVSVCDCGPGIAATHLAQLFDSFFTTRSDGMGMGLRICRSIIEAHGGSIHAQNRSDGPGARFWFSLPTVRQTSQAAVQRPGQDSALAAG